MSDSATVSSVPAPEPRIELLPIDGPLVELVAQWLAAVENSRWLDFGNGGKPVTAAWVKVVARSDRHLLRVFAADGVPVGVVALGDIHRTFRTATLWFVLGDKRYARLGLTTQAAAEILTVGFRDLDLHTINTWTVEGNPSMKIIAGLDFKPIGRQRQCHWMDGVAYDRILWDMLASEHRQRRIT